MKRKRSDSMIEGVQKSLSFFGDEKRDEKIIEKEEKTEEIKLGEIKTIHKEEKTEEIKLGEIKTIHKENVENKIEKRLSNQIETDYYELSRIETCAKRLRERFNIDINIIPVRYGTKPPINEKIYGYYMLITVKGRGMESIIEFIRNGCNLKVYT